MFSVYMVLIKQPPFFVILPVLNHIKRQKHPVCVESGNAQHAMLKNNRHKSANPAHITFTLVTIIVTLTCKEQKTEHRRHRTKAAGCVLEVVLQHRSFHHTAHAAG